MNNKDKKIFFVAIFLVLFQNVFVAMAILYTYLSIYALIVSVFTSFCLLIAYVSNIEDNEEPSKFRVQTENKPTFADIEPLDSFKKTMTLDVEEPQQVPRPMSIDLGQQEEIKRYAAITDEPKKE